MGYQNMFDEQSLNAALLRVSLVSYGPCNSDYYLARQTAAALVALIELSKNRSIENLNGFKERFISFCRTIVGYEDLYRRTDGRSEICAEDEKAHHDSVKNMLAMHRLRWEMLKLISEHSDSSTALEPATLKLYCDKINILRDKLDPNSYYQFRDDYQRLILEMKDNLQRLKYAVTTEDKFKLHKELAWRFYKQYSALEIETRSMSISFYPQQRRQQEQQALEEHYDRMRYKQMMTHQANMQHVRALERRSGGGCNLWPLAFMPLNPFLATAAFILLDD